MLLRGITVVTLVLSSLMYSSVWAAEPRSTRTDSDLDVEDASTLETESISPPNYYTTGDYTSEGCSCDCGGRPPGNSSCVWKMVFKAVKGNGRDVSSDLARVLSSINEGMPEAEEITGNLPYMDSHIFDDWVALYTKRVKLELFDEGERMVWFYFDGTGSKRYTWFSEDRLIASSYPTLKDGNSGRFRYGPGSPFSITSGTSCDTDCGYLRVIEEVSDERCDYENREQLPYFLYSPYADGCAFYNDEALIADRLVISVMICDDGMDYFALRDHPYLLGLI